MLKQAEQVYRQCSKTASVAAATILTNDDDSKNMQVVSNWSQRNLDTMNMAQFSLHHHIRLTDDDNIEKVERTHTLPVESRLV